MKNFVDIPEKLVRITKAHDKVIITVVGRDGGEKLYFKCVLSPQRAADLGEVILDHAYIIIDGKEGKDA